MAKEFNVAVAGATGAVGVEMIKTLEKRNFPVKNLKLLASARSAGKTAKFKGTYRKFFQRYRYCIVQCRRRHLQTVPQRSCKFRSSHDRQLQCFPYGR